MEKYTDLHLHTNFSDGSYTPEELVRRAAELGFSAISVTDHDSVEGIPAAIVEAEKYNMEVIPGVELSAEIGRTEVHFLGYFIDWKNAGFLEQLAGFRARRQKRAEEIVAKLHQMNVRIDISRVNEIAGYGAVGRLHIAQVLKEKGYISDINQAFRKYIGDQSPAYVPKNYLTVRQAIKMIDDIGGIACLAHPAILNKDELIPDFMTNGLKAIEVYYSEQWTSVTRHYEQIADKFGLLMTGGSDCHGPAKGRLLMGTVKVPYTVLEKLKNRVRSSS